MKEPNEETLKSFEEGKDPKLKRYKSKDELFKELDNLRGVESDKENESL